MNEDIGGINNEDNKFEDSRILAFQSPRRILLKIGYFYPEFEMMRWSLNSTTPEAFHHGPCRSLAIYYVEGDMLKRAMHDI